MENILAQLLGVFGIAFFSFWASIPAGLALGLSPVLVAATATVSYAAGVGLVLLIGERIRAPLMRRFGATAIYRPESAIRRAWDRYGLVGLGLIAPMLTGSMIGAAIGLALGTPPRRLFAWMVVGAGLWSVLITLAVLAGVIGVRALR